MVWRARAQPATVSGATKRLQDVHPSKRKKAQLFLPLSGGGGLGQPRISRNVFHNLGGIRFRKKFREIRGVGAKCDNVRIFAQYFAFDPHPTRRLVGESKYPLPSHGRANQPMKRDEPDETKKWR